MTVRAIIRYFLYLLLPCFCTAASLQTPLERDNYSKLSSHSDMMSYLKKLDSQSRILTMSIIGKSVQGRAIPALYFSLDKTFGSNREKKLLVLIYCQQHGDEPSGKEAALIVARDLADRNSDILKYTDLILVPQVNPDGAEMEQRENANEMDLNRNHAILSEPEVLAVHDLFLKWMPEVTLDMHEYNAISKNWISNGFIRDAEEMIGGVTNLNIAPQIMEFSRNVFIPGFGKLVQKDGFSFSRYIVGAPFEDQRIRYSTTAINDGRQSPGIYNSLSFIIEGKKYGSLINLIERRTMGQVSAIWAFLNTAADNHKEIGKIVTASRRQLMEDRDTEKRVSYIQMDYFPDPGQDSLSFPVFDLYSWQRVERRLGNYEPIVKVRKSVEKPHAYIFSKNEHRLIDLLSRHQIEMHYIQTEVDIDIEAYTILHVTPSVEEDKPSTYVDVSVQKETKRIEQGSVVVFLNQRASNLIPLLLEPHSSWGICTENSGRKYRFAEYLQEGQQYPIFRMMRAATIETDLLEIGK
ncbi:MAG: DUF2817 domain-containing protein [Fidelibacterota bacterium]|nr:MAG: DUF2817 domain-containing protein [Candidatus Neomarinimicrobiota bacterium]